MEANSHAYQNGNASRTNSVAVVQEGGLHVPRIMTVDEALPYSPFSSVVPFNSDLIPLPIVGLRSSTSIFSTPQERAEGRRGLDALNREAQLPSNTSQKLQKSLNDLKELLNPSTIPLFKFKTSPKFNSRNGSKEPLKVNLSPFARMVYESTNIEFTYPSPQTPSPPTQSSKLASTQLEQTLKPRSLSDQKLTPITTQPKPPSSLSRSLSDQRSLNQAAYQQNTSLKIIRQGSGKSVIPKAKPATQPNSSFSVVIPSLTNSFQRNEYTLSQEASLDNTTEMATKVQIQIQPPSHTNTQSLSPPPPPVVLPNQKPHPAPQSAPPPESSTSHTSALSVVIPDLPSTFRQEDYNILPDSPETPTHLSRKRKRSDIDGEEDDLSRSVDQREKADATFKHLREYLQEIFEAEDQLQPDNFIPNQFYTASSDGYTLTVNAQTKVESLLQKIISAGRFANVPVDDLLRLQKLCDAGIKDAENVDVKLDESMGQAEVEQWLLHATSVELGMKSARTSLRLMSGGREEKQLYSEDVIQSALNAFKNVTENCLIPIVEMRSTGSSSNLFKLLSAEKKAIMSLLTHARRLFQLMAILVLSIELSDTVITTLEFTASKLIFVETAHSEKDSVLGVSKFDSLRVAAMDVLAQIFMSNPQQRAGIFDDILTSLEKLPVTKQSARQFKLAEGANIQLVSALIMRLIQTSATKTEDIKHKRRSKALEALDGEDDADEGQSKKPPTTRIVITSETKAEQQPVTAIQELKDAATPLLDSAKSSATYVVGFIVSRAMKSTKTGDAPYRNLLDLFVEDFIACLKSTDWPAAELLLRLFLFKMVHLAEGDKTPAPAKNMALDLLAVMGAAISDLSSQVRKSASSFDSGEDVLGKYLSSLAAVSLEKKAVPADLVSWPCGPFRTCLEFLEERSSSAGYSQLSSAIGFFMAEWACKIFTTFDMIHDDDGDAVKLEEEYGRLAYRLRMMISDSRWLSTEYSFETVTPAHARLAYSLTLLHSQFCQSFGRVLTILLGSMTSEQATVRSKSLKSVNQVLDTDPTIIDREPAVMHLILRCANDTSIQVRDSALGLIGKCIHLRPALEEEMIPNILARVNDSGVGVRKRAIKLSKDIYLKNASSSVRSLIADALLHRVNDQDEGVQELARQTIEEVWMSPFHQPSTDPSSPKYKLAMADHVALMVKTVQRGGGVATVLDKVLQGILSSTAKSTAQNFQVCKALVATMFETIIDNSATESNDAPSARDALQILTIFAKSNPELFTAEQVQLLQPYISHVGSGDDLLIYRSVVIIFRHVLPNLSKAQHNFLAAIRKELITAVSKMPKAILDDLVACIWNISTVLDDFQHLTRLVLSSLVNIQKMKGIELDDAGLRKICKLLLIAGTCGKHCDLDPQYETFEKQFPSMKDRSVSRLMTDTFAPFASPSQPLKVRESALESIGMVCQAWPKNFLVANVNTSFREVFHEENAALEAIIMRSFKDFMLLEEKRSEAQSDDLPSAAADPKAKLGVMGGGQGDGVALSISQQFLPRIIEIALSRQDEDGLLATELVASVARQGLVHPKETGSSLIALETSQNAKISDIAFREHRALHEKHETILEKEYMRAVHLAYTYQKNVTQNTHGATLNPYTSKLHRMVEVMKISKPKSRKRFYDSLCARMEFDPLKTDGVELGEHLEFSQFIIENIAFFEYVSIDELISAISAMEKVVASMGASVAHSIETEIFQINLDQPSHLDENGQLQPVEVKVDPFRLKKLTAVSMMLSSLWEARTYLRRQYGLVASQREGKNKLATKDLNKAPVRVQGVNADKFWDETNSTMNSLESEEQMMAQCRSFVELLTVDHDFKVAADGDEEAERARITTPDGEEEETSNAGTPGPPGSKRGRKRKDAPSGTPGGRKKRARSGSAQPRSRGRPKVSGNKRASVDRSDEDGNAY